MPTAVPLFVSACLVLGWIVPLVAGIVRLRRSGSDAVGLALTTVGRVWCVGGLVLGVCGGMFWLMFRLGGPDSQIEQFDPSRHDGPMGAVVVPYEGEALLHVTSTADGKMMALSTGDGRFEAPVGEYRLRGLTVKKTGEDNSQWEATTLLAQDEPRQVSVRADGEASLDLGPPFTASIAVAAEPQNVVELDLEIADSQGCQYTIVKIALGGTPPPRFEVRFSSGELVLEGQFEYG